MSSHSWRKIRKKDEQISSHTLLCIIAVPDEVNINVAEVATSSGTLRSCDSRVVKALVGNAMGFLCAGSNPVPSGSESKCLSGFSRASTQQILTFSGLFL